MGLRFFGIAGIDLAGMQQQINDAMAAAQQAQATGANARQMVLNRDPQLATLADAASQLPLTQASAAIEHAEIRALITALTTRVAGLEGKAVASQVKRVTSASTLALGATVDLTATWSPSFPDANYIALPVLDAAAGLVNISTPAIKSQTKDACVVTFRTNVALLSSVTINVIGLRFG